MLIVVYGIVFFIGILLGTFLGVWGTINASDMLSQRDKDKILKRLK